MSDGQPFNPNEHLKLLRGKEYLEVKWRLVWFHQETGPRAGYVTIELEHDRERGYARYAAVAWNGQDETWREITIHGQTISVCGRVGMGTKSETRADFADFGEKAETGALGRALAGLGYGTQFAPDVEEGSRIVDSPIERQPQTQAKQREPAEPERTAAPDPRAELRKQARAQGYTDESFDDLMQQYTYDGRVDLRQVKGHLDAEKNASRGAAAQPKEEPKASAQQLQSIRKLCITLGREEPAPDTLTFTSAGALIRQLSREYNTRRRAG